MVKILLLVLCFFILGNANVTVEKTTAMYIDKRGIEKTKDALIKKAKREAVSEIYGDFIDSSVKVRNGKLESDEIIALVVGSVKVKGDPKFANGDNLGEMKVTILATATKDELEEAKRVLKRRIDVYFENEKAKKVWLIESKDLVNNSSSILKEIRKNILSVDKRIEDKIVSILDLKNKEESKLFVKNTLKYIDIPDEYKEINFRDNKAKAIALNKLAEKEYKKYLKSKDKELLKSSIQTYLESISLDKEYSQAYSNLSLAYFRAKNYKYSVWAGLESLKYINDSKVIASSLYNIGRSFEKLEKFEESLIFYITSSKLRKEGKIKNIVLNRIEKVMKKAEL